MQMLQRGVCTARGNNVHRQIKNQRTVYYHDTQTLGIIYHTAQNKPLDHCYDHHIIAIKNPETPTCLNILLSLFHTSHIKKPLPVWQNTSNTVVLHPILLKIKYTPGVATPSHH